MMTTTTARPAQLRLYWDCCQRHFVKLTRPGDLLLGSSPRADIQVPDRTVSGLHCTFSRDGSGHTFISDLNSRNGTRVNGRPLRARLQLESGDLIQIGYVSIIFLDEAEL